MGLARSDGRLKLIRTCCSDEYKMSVVGMADEKRKVLEKEGP